MLLYLQAFYPESPPWLRMVLAMSAGFLLTGGVAPIPELWFWGALSLSLIVGFLAPLPYNYWRFKSRGEAFR